jgi:predicted glycosyltransferase
MNDAERSALRHTAAGLAEVSWQDFSDDMMSLMAAADVVVAMGGYNTVCELLTLRKRAVVVPRTKPGLEQCIRAERMSALGLLRMLHPSRLGPAALLDAVQAELEAGTAPATLAGRKSLDGLAHCSAALLGLIGLAPASPAATRPIPAHAAEPAHQHHHHHDTAPTQSPPWNRHPSSASARSAC